MAKNTMEKLPGPVLRSVSILAIVGIAFIVMGLTIFVHVVNGDVYLAALLILCGLAIISLGSLALWGFYHPKGSTLKGSSEE